MSKENQKTLEVYERRLQEYIDGTQKERRDEIDSWIRNCFRHIKTNAKILEIGSAFGQDAKFINNLGYKVEVTDVADSFIEELKRRGFAPSKFNLLEDNFRQHYDVIFAKAVLLHFTRVEIKQSISKVFDALTDNGVFMFTLKEGDGEAWSGKDGKMKEDRYFVNWREKDVRKILEDVGFSAIKVSYADKISQSGAKWLFISATKEAK